MKFCKNCGNAIDDNAIFCKNCGTRVNGDDPHFGRNPFDRYNPGRPYVEYDTQGSMLVAVISFLCWQAGLVLWLVWRFSNPGKARSAAKGALASACVSMPVLGAVLWLIWKDDMAQKDYAKLCGISAIVGIALAVLSFVFVIIIKLLGMPNFGIDPSLPHGDTFANIFNILR